MIVVVVSLGAAAVQMAMLLLTAHVLGVGQYTRFSLIVAIALVLSSVTSEWLRLIVARHGGSRRRRFRGAVLRDARRITFALSSGLILLGLLSSAGTAATGHPDFAQLVAATAVSAAGMMVSDMASVALRYGAVQQWQYNLYTAVRVTMMGSAALVAAIGGGNGAAAAGAFGLAGILVGGCYGLLLSPQGGVSRPGLVRRLSPQGWSLATGSIGTNLALTMARLAIGVGLHGAIAGSVLLAIDLFSRGANVFGTALCTWGNRELLDGLHRDGPAGAMRAFRRFSAVFLSGWFSIALLGMAACVIIPIYTLHVTRIAQHTAATLPTLAAIALLFLRIFLFDCLLAALNKHREIALISSLTAGLAALCAAVSVLTHNLALAILLFPAAVAVLSAIYAFRNFLVFAAAIDRQAVRFALGTIMVLGVSAAAASLYPHAITLGLIATLMLTLDARQAQQLLKRLPRRGTYGDLLT